VFFYFAFLTSPISRKKYLTALGGGVTTASAERTRSEREIRMLTGQRRSVRRSSVDDYSSVGSLGSARQSAS
jgi:hypothetical protein